MADTDAASTAPSPAPDAEPKVIQYFTPPPGGNVILRSIDHVGFCVHSIMLAMVSPVFGGMFELATKQNTIDMAEDAATISWFLQFLYPTVDPPTITNLELLCKCLKFAQKYDVERMRDVIDIQLASNTTPQALVRNDILQVYDFAHEFSLPQTKRATLMRMTAEARDFSDPETLVAFAAERPDNVPIIALIGAQAARMKILGEVLLDYSCGQMRPNSSSSEWFQLRCDTCKEGRNRSYGYDQYEPSWALPPSWAIHWSRLAFESLLQSPLEDVDHLFNVLALSDSYTQGSDICTGCLDDLFRDPGNHDIFSDWADNVREELRQRLQSLEPLYAL